MSQKQKTALMILIDYMNGDGSYVVPYVDPKILYKATELLETEKEQIMQPIVESIVRSCFCMEADARQSAETYYQMTYGDD